MRYYLSECHNNIHRTSRYKYVVDEVANCLLPDGTKLPLVVGETYRVYFYTTNLVAFYPHIEGEEDLYPDLNSPWYLIDEYLDYFYSKECMMREEKISKLIS